MKLDITEIKSFLDEKVDKYNQPSFISSDPVQVPHSFAKKQDIEISGLFAATLAWGKRVIIIKNSNRLMSLMGNQPYDFVLNHSKDDLNVFDEFKHRTYNGDDVRFFIKGLKEIYKQYDSLENVFVGNTPFDGIMNFRKHMFEAPHEYRSEKHISKPDNGSAAKRLNMFLRWMIRKDKSGVDFGIWDVFAPSQLYIPLDVHSGRIARAIGLLERKQNDRKAVELLTKELRILDPVDPIKYDFALFGLGVFEDF